MNARLSTRTPSSTLSLAICPMVLAKEMYGLGPCRVCKSQQPCIETIADYLHMIGPEDELSQSNSLSWLDQRIRGFVPTLKPRRHLFLLRIYCPSAETALQKACYTTFAKILDNHHLLHYQARTPSRQRLRYVAQHMLQLHAYQYSVQDIYHVRHHRVTAAYDYCISSLS